MPPLTGSLVLFRHGQTEYNVRHWMTGLHDPPLTEVGEAQARAAGPLIAGFHFAAAYSSTLQRAHRTAELALAASGTNRHLRAPDGAWRIERRAELVEADAGAFSARDKFKDPEILAYPHLYDVALPGGESDRQMVARIQGFYDAVLIPHLTRGETVLVSNHSGIMVGFEIVVGLRPVPVEDVWSRRSGVPYATPVVFAYSGGPIPAKRELAIS